MKNDPASKEVREWIDKMIDRRLTPDEYETFESRLFSDPEVADLYVDTVLTHSILSLVLSDSDDIDKADPLLESGPRFTSAQRTKAENKTTLGRLLFPSGILSLLLLLCFTALFFGRNRGETTFATITVTKGCLWENSTALTPPGSRLGPSELNLKDGITRIDFDCGAVVWIEGPCRFELTAPKECVLHDGKAVIEADSEQAKGFIMVTPTTIIKDVGTAFHVNVPKSGTTEVAVLKGRVDVQSRETGETAVLLRGEVRSFPSDQGRQEPNLPEKPAEDKNTIQLSTAFGRGRETSIIFGEDQIDEATGIPLVRSHEYMQVKTSIPKDLKSNRKAFFRFDLESLASDRLANRTPDSVALLLSYGPTRLGFAAFVPDSTFVVYGYVGGTDDFWDREPLSWKSIPGNLLRSEMEPDRWRPLGRFTIMQGDISGSIRIEGEELTRFCNEKRVGRDETITFALVRETEAEQISGMVHGFANRYHPELSPPRLVFYDDPSESPIPETNGP